MNERLRTQGAPPVRADQLEATARDAVQSAVREGSVNRSTLVRSIVQDTALSQADAEEVASRIETQVEDAKGQVTQRLQAAETGALKAAEASGKAFWGVFGALLLGLIAAVIGAALGVPAARGRRRAYVAAPTPVAPPPPTRPREVYP